MAVAEGPRTLTALGVPLKHLSLITVSYDDPQVVVQ